METIETTCSFSGHRILGGDFDEMQLEFIISEIIKKGYNKFLVGMALGFDSKCFKILEKLKLTRNIKIVACIPCSEQADSFSQSNKNEYYRMIKVADEQILISPSYFKGCMQKRNRFMVDNSSLLVCYLNKNSGGTYSTVEYAKKLNKQIIKI